MIVKITSKRQVTFPAHVLDAMGVGPGDHLEIQETPEGYLLKAQAHRPFPAGPSQAPDTGRLPAFRHQEIPGWNL